MRPEPRLARRSQSLAFGACLLLLAALPARSDAGDWSLPDGRMGIRTAPLLLLTRPDVQADLGLNPTQRASMQQMLEQLSQRAQALRGKSGSEILAERRAIDDAQGHWLTSNLTEPQLERLSQIDLQWEGSSALISRPAVVDTLKLSGRQVHELTRLIADRNGRILKSGFNPAEEAEVRRQTLAVLSNPQLQAWNGMLGEHCRFTAVPVEDAAVQQAEHVSPR